MDIGVLIRDARRAAGVSQADLARRSGTSQPAIARLEAGRGSPSIATVDRILRALGCTLELAAREVDTGVDRTLIAQMLRLTPTDRLRKLKQEHDAVARLRAAVRA